MNSMENLPLTVAGLFRRREEAFVALLGTSIPFLFLAGFAWPVEAIPTPLRVVSWLVPSTPGIAGFLRVNQMGASLAEVAREWRGLWCLAALYLLTAWAVEHRRLKKLLAGEPSSDAAPTGGPGPEESPRPTPH